MWINLHKHWLYKTITRDTFYEVCIVSQAVCSYYLIYSSQQSYEFGIIVSPIWNTRKLKLSKSSLLEVTQAVSSVFLSLSCCAFLKCQWLVPLSSRLHGEVGLHLGQLRSLSFPCASYLWWKGNPEGFWVWAQQLAGLLLSVGVGKFLLLEIVSILLSTYRITSHPSRSRQNLALAWSPSWHFHLFCSTSLSVYLQM